MTVRLTIDIWSDVVCPWCIIGYKQLEKALASLAGEIEAEVRWRAFELNPAMPEEGEDSAYRMLRKYGTRPAGAGEDGQREIDAIAEDAGYSFAYTGADKPPPRRMWNTFLAHKLLAHALLAHGAEAQGRLAMRLFDAHFRERRNLSDREVLLDAAASVGLPRAATEAALGNPALAEHVRADEEQALDTNITGVPAMLIGGRLLVPGAQDPSVYVNALRRVAARQASLGATGPG